MSDFFDDSHVTDVGLEGSAGPSVSIWDMVEQGFRQQYRVDSQRALDEELRTRWAESLQALSTAGQRFNAPIDPMMYRGFAQFVRDGTPVTTPTVEGSGYGARINYDAQQPHTEFEEMRRANEAIRQLNNPDIRTFEQILEEVSEMQRGVEEQTASMSGRAGASGVAGELLGAIIGSFTPRDPLNVVTAPIGAGRTIATRIASDMLVAAGVVTATEFGDVAPNRALAGLPERNPLYNIVAATLGAGIIRGALIEPAGYAMRRFRDRPTFEDIDFDLRDSQLRQMFETDAGPTARAGTQALDDVTFIERNNPYGEGQAAQARFLAELQEVQRVMNGEPMTAVARVLPPMPFEYIQKAADFEIVREQAPQVYARMEQAQAALAKLTDRVNNPVPGNIRGDLPATGLAPANVAEDGSIYVGRQGGSHFEVTEQFPENAGKWTGDTGFVTPEGKYLNRQEALEWTKANNEAIRPSSNMEGELDALDYRDQSAVIRAAQKANREYQKAYRAVEAEAVRLREQQDRVGAIEQGKAANILAVGLEGRPFIGPALHHDYVKELTERINAFNDTLDETAVAAFVRQMEGEGEEVLGREAWLTEDGRVDIGLREPVDPDFRFDTEDGEISVAAAMRDLQDDADLDDAMRKCML